MRPNLLKMRAFGCYADETEVDFDKLSGNLYLIVGKTGAGKTTIFDAISFALFGRPSGSERQTAMLHSDFVPMSEDTLVTLDFTHQGRSYRVERRLHFQKSRASGQYEKMTVGAVMSGGEQPPVEGAEKVTSRCEELLGLNAEQFRRIVMLAQGEFREFLRSGSDKKNEILGRLFDNTEYVRYQNLLDSVRSRLEKERRDKRAEIESAMGSQFSLPPEEAERQSDYLPGHPRLSENLRELVEREELRLKELSDLAEKRKTETEALARQEGAAENDNNLFSELENKRAHLTGLDARLSAYERRERDYQAAEKALHRVLPEENERARAAAQVKNTETALREQEKQLTEQEKRYREALAVVEGDKDKASHAENLSVKITKRKEVLPRYGELAEKKKERDATRVELDGAARRMEQKKGALSALSDKLLAQKEELASLEGCDVEEFRLEKAHENAEDRLRELSDLSQKVRDVFARDKFLSEENLLLSSLAQTAAREEASYHALYQAFLDGQAGLIAAGMEKELAEIGETVCPVCNTRFMHGSAHRFAIPAERVPEQAEVDEAEKRFKAAETDRREKSESISALRESIRQKKETLAEQMRKLEPGCTDWDTLSGPGWLDALCQRLTREKKEIGLAYAAAKDRCEHRNELLSETETGEKQQDTLDRQLKEDEKTLGESKLRLGVLDSDIAGIEKDLPFSGIAEAEDEIRELEREREALTLEIEKHKDTLNNAKEARDLTAGKQRQLNEDLPVHRRAQEEAEQRLSQALRENGFSSWPDAEAALAPIGEEDGEHWLQKEQTALRDYHTDRKNTGDRILELKAQTAGKSPVDLTELKEALDQARSGQNAAEEARSALRTVLDGHRRVSERVSAAAAELRRTEGAFQRIERLANMAVGTNADGGKLSFDRYVMGTVFQEVLAVANYRLNIMTGGRFELKHTLDAGRRNAVAGLEIEILDVASGKQRASGSISGGEGFMVSLALALGLSDVVQSHAGGQKLETLFIDEGFGTLDDGKLDNVIDVLKQLTEGNRLVGVISHVDTLVESIHQKLRVKSTDRGSTLVPELS